MRTVLVLALDELRPDLLARALSLVHLPAPHVPYFEKMGLAHIRPSNARFSFGIDTFLLPLLLISCLSALLEEYLINFSQLAHQCLVELIQLSLSRLSDSCQV